MKDHTKKIQDNALLRSRLQALQGEKPFALESAGMIGGVKFINDSAATSMDKVAESLMLFEEKVLWIVEANQSGADFELLKEVSRNHVKILIAVGQYADEAFQALWTKVGMYLSAKSWEEALDLSLIVAKANDTVLFSPGCRAGEPFENYKERGAYFNRLINIKNLS